jgi:hypothetical protein
VKEIMSYGNIKRSTVYDVKKKFDKFIASGGSADQFLTARKVHKRRSDYKGTALAADLEELISRDPGRSMRSLALELDVSRTTVRKIVLEDLRYKSYAMRRGHFMSAATKARRLDKAKRLLTKIKHPIVPNPLIFFSDEKNFTQDQKVNRKNNRWLCFDPTEVPKVMSTKFPATVMVLGVVSNEGDVMPPHIFPKGLRVDTGEYLNVMETVVKPWMDQIAGNRHYIFQQDGAPAHNSKKTQNWLKKNLPEMWEKEVWPPSSPDCNPMDYFVWGVTELRVNKKPHNKTEDLIQKIKEVMGSLDRDTVAKACKRFRSRIEAVVAADGDFIE